jgi:WD40 repeat protein
MATSTRVAREEAENRRSKQYTLTEVAFRRDFREPVSDAKFNPNGDMIAAASNDDTICIYGCEVVSEHNQVACTLKPLHRLRGHSSYITHIDWSRDGALLRSTCGAYELLYWSIESGKQFTGPNADVAFKTDNCPLGFAMMGIWSPYMDGTDINAVDVGSFEDCPDKLVFCGDDNAKLSMINYPCVVKHAPRKEYTGHGSHVTNVRFYQTYRSRDSVGVPWVASTGGRDASIITWACTPTPVSPPIRKYVHKLN